MRVLLISLVIGFSAQAMSCEKPITINYAPFVSLLVVQKYFGGFHQHLKETSGCLIDYKIQQNFEDFIESLFRHEHTLAIVPGPYFDILKNLDYVAIASKAQTETRKTYVISRKEDSFINMQSLSGRKVLVSSPLTSSGSYFVEELMKLNLVDKVQIEYDNAYDAMLLNVLRNSVDAVVVIEEYWNILDDKLKAHKLKVLAEIDSPASIEVVLLKERQELASIVFDALQLSEIEWAAPKADAVGSSLLRTRLNQKLKEYRQTMR